MEVFLTTQTKLAAAVGITPEHLSKIKTGAEGVSSQLAEKLAEITQIKITLWAGSVRGSNRLELSLAKFLKKEKEREKMALSVLSAKKHAEYQKEQFSRGARR